MPRYDFKQIETHWQAFWEANETFRTPDVSPGGETFYVLDMFPYPSGNGLHVGHPEGYTATDIVARYYRMRGRHVLHPMGWDAFGLPAEQHAIRTGTPPRETTNRNIDNFRRQLKMLGFSYDWSREVATTDPTYFRWTQWIFLELFDSWYDPDVRWTGPDGNERIGRGRPIAELPIPENIQAEGETAVRRYQDGHRLAYQHEAPVNWCPKLGTVLANEEVDAAGKSERGSHPVVRIPLRQWMLRITAYAERLIDELDDLDWSESIKILQRNWIGRSEGAEVDFHIGPADESADGSASGSESLDAARKRWQAERAASGFLPEPNDDVLRIYTTRPDTLFGATYMVLAPEHPFVERLTTEGHREEVAAYGRQAATKSDLDRTDLAKEKTGVFTGSFAINPVSGERIPIWIADYVLISYGTGAIMAVPAHDLRDWEFAVTFGLPIVPVVERPAGSEPTKEEQALALSDSDGSQPTGLCPFSGEGTAIHSGEYDGLETAEFRRKITADLSRNGLGRGAVNYRLRDWLFSRQHFWGEPFPIWHELDAAGQPTGLLRTDSADRLPITLPEAMEFNPTGTPDPPLAKAPDDWLYKTDSDGTRLLRETNTMPQWAGSCWYYLRFLDPHNSERFVDPEKEKRWMPVDLYIGGAEHAVLHLLYARFWHKVLFDRGHLSTAEPFQRLVNQGMILGEPEFYVLQSEDGEFTSFDPLATDGVITDPDFGFRVVVDGKEYTRRKAEDSEVEKRGGDWYVKGTNAKAVSRTYKMSKSRGNVINPDDIVAEYGADSLRLYEMFMGPLEQMKPWNMSGVEGVSRFLGRVWRMIVDDRAEDVCFAAAVQDVEPTEEQWRVLHRTIKVVTEDIEKLSFNTAISRMMEFTNEISRQDPRPRAVLEPFVLLLSPFAPHMAEELWRLFGHAESLAYHPWPAYDEQRIAEAEVEVPVQINGKLRSRVRVPAEADQETIRRAAEADEVIGRNLEGKTVIKVIVVPGRLVNFVVKGA